MIEFVVHGNPVPKGRPRLGKGNQTYTPKVTKDWEKTVGEWCNTVTRGDRFECDVSVWLVFYRRTRHTVDLDNLIKSVLDGMNGVAYTDDTQVVEIHAWLKYDKVEPRVEVKVKPI